MTRAWDRLRIRQRLLAWDDTPAKAWTAANARAAAVAAMATHAIAGGAPVAVGDMSRTCVWAFG